MVTETIVGFHCFQQGAIDFQNVLQSGSKFQLFAITQNCANFLPWKHKTLLGVFKILLPSLVAYLGNNVVLFIWGVFDS